ncbi:RTA1-like protein [Armillaria novae-zelandiae]|uniref:RTA1-like protein n=1 Tax=Armillaria novae-zelandiae TaxID=153914 RepID=A0AA39P225_9AGAR|nr:RTA1-like protein [Armillaria novae-zelandiae]
MSSTIMPLVLRSGSMDPADSPYNYIPSTTIAIIFVVLYSVSTILHVGQGIYYRMWWVFPTICLAGIMEVLGWSGRLWSSYSPKLLRLFLAPTPLVAANFVILGVLIKRLGSAYSRLTPRMFCFCILNPLTTIVYRRMVFGGGIASAADTLPAANKVSRSFSAGECFNFKFVITVYVICAAEFLVRYVKDRPIASPRLLSRRHERGKSLLMLGALALSTIFLYIRAVYRTIELSDGWNGVIISTQVYFNVFDGAMVVLAIYIMNFAHPGFLLGSEQAVLSSADPSGSLELGTEETVMAERK